MTAHSPASKGFSASLVSRSVRPASPSCLAPGRRVALRALVVSLLVLCAALPAVGGTAGGNPGRGDQGAASNNIALSSLSFAITGNTRPPTEDDTAGYPVAIITKIFQDMQAASPQPAFAIATGTYMFSNPTVNGTQGTQLDDYLTASSNFSGMLYPAMGNHECDGVTADNCSTDLTGNTYDYIAFYDQMLQPIGLQLPYYTVNFAGPNNAWTAKFVFVACNAWSTQQAAWLNTALSQPTTYTFAIWNEPVSANTAPCLSGTGSNNALTILNQYPYSLLINGFIGTYEYLISDNEVIVGNGGAPLSDSVDYGYVIAQQQTNGQIVFTEYDYETNVVNNTFTIGAVLAANTVTFTTPAPSSAEYGSSFTVAASGLGTGAMNYTSGGSCSNLGATYTMTSGMGACTVTATQTADSTYASANASNSVTGEPAMSSVSVALTSGTDPSTYDGSITFTATVSSDTGAVKGRKITTRPMDLNGSVAWGANTGCAASGVSGNPPQTATCTTSMLAVGTDTVTAMYTPSDSNHTTASGFASQTVNPAPNTITCNPNAPPTILNNETFTMACSSSTPVTYSNSGSCTGSGGTYTVSGTPGKTCTVMVNAAAQGNYSAAPTLTETTAIEPAYTPIVSLSASAASAQYQSIFTVTPSTNAGNNNAAAITSMTATVCTASGATITVLKGSATCKLKAAWPATYVYKAATAEVSVATTALTTTTTITSTTGTDRMTVFFAVVGSNGATPPGSTEVTDGNGHSCKGTPTRGYCMLAPGYTGSGSATLTATYAGDDDYVTSPSALYPITY